jgi:hypothetical protein
LLAISQHASDDAFGFLDETMGDFVGQVLRDGLVFGWWRQTLLV